MLYDPRMTPLTCEAKELRIWKGSCEDNRVYLNKFDGFEFESERTFIHVVKRVLELIELKLHVAGSVSTPMYMDEAEPREILSVIFKIPERHKITKLYIYTQENKENYKKEPLPRNCTSF